ncbi:MAG: hypothetical protein WC642_06470 [Nocardioides sp.]|jgi:hypothetical protein
MSTTAAPRRATTPTLTEALQLLDHHARIGALPADEAPAIRALLAHARFDNADQGSGPDQTDVDALRDLLDLMETFSDNDQRARYLLSSNWLRDRGAAASVRVHASLSAAQFTLETEVAPAGGRAPIEAEEPHP